MNYCTVVLREIHRDTEDWNPRDIARGFNGIQPAAVIGLPVNPRNSAWNKPLSIRSDPTPPLVERQTVGVERCER